MNNFLKVFAAAATAVCAVSPLLATPPGIARGKEADATRWADSVYATLTPRQRVAQLIFPKVNPAGAAASRNTITRYVRTEGFGGLLFSEGSLEQYVEMTNLAQSEARVPLIMTFDGEWGLSMRIPETPRFPQNMALGAISDMRLLYDYGREMARECRLMGIQTNFAPDADVNSNPSNPVIGFRAFGEDPQRVAKATVAYTLGMEDAGVQAVPKHFPGHGDTSLDSHKTITSVSHTRAQLDSTDLVPFHAVVEAGGSSIMIGHLVVASLDASLAPASLSNKITTGLLREEMGFDGLIYTDALGMRGAVDPAGRNPALAALLAGADVLLCPSKPVEALQAIMSAINAGTVTENMVADRCKRILRYKYYLGLDVRPQVNTDIAALRRELASPAAEDLIRKLADASITVLRNTDSLLPVGNLAGRRISVVIIGAGSDNIFAETCRHYADVNIFGTSGGHFSQTTLARINDADMVIAAVYSNTSAAKETVAQLSASSPALVGAFMMNPYRMASFRSSLPPMKGLVLAYDTIAASGRAAAEAIFGGIAVSGRLPVGLRAIAPSGAGIDLPKTRLGFSSPVAEGLRPCLSDSIDAIVRDAMRDGAFPGCQVLVAKGGNIVFNRAYGRTGSAGSPEVKTATVYDLASVSKAIGTLPGIMKACDDGLLDLDDRLADLIPQITDPAKSDITVRQLLFHETGMPASLNMYGVMIDSASFTGRLITSRRDAAHGIRIGRRAYGHNNARLRSDITTCTASDDFPVEAAKGIYTGQSTYDSIMRRIYDIPLRSSRAYNYSCLNFCLLMDIEQRLTGRNHDEYVTSGIFAPLGAYRTGYRPLSHFAKDDIAPTENDTFLRRQTVHGYVHDELAAFSGGVQGNAGLFANADDIAKVCQMLLNGGTYGGVRVLSPQTVALFTGTKSPTCRRGLGFDKPDTENLDNSPTCDEASAAVFGHLGFTGTCFWVDPEEEIIFVFLTNRVYPTRENAAFNRSNIRPRLFSQVYKALDK